MKYIKKLNINFDNWDEIDNQTIKFNHLYDKVKIGYEILASIKNHKRNYYTIVQKRNKKLMIKNKNNYHIIDKYSDIQIYNIVSDHNFIYIHNMKYIKKLNINFDDWEEYKDVNIENHLLNQFNSNKITVFFINKNKNINEFCKLLLNIIYNNFPNKEIKINACDIIDKNKYHKKNIYVVIIFDKFNNIYIYHTVDRIYRYYRSYYDIDKNKLIYQ